MSNDKNIETICEELIRRRMVNTGETRKEASEHIANYLQQTIKENN